MNKIPVPGERIVFKGKSGYVATDFKGYDILEIGKSYIVEHSFRISEERAADPLEYWCVSLINIKEYGYALDCFERLDEHRIKQISNLLD